MTKLLAYIRKWWKQEQCRHTSMSTTLNRITLYDKLNSGRITPEEYANHPRVFDETECLTCGKKWYF